MLSKQKFLKRIKNPRFTRYTAILGVRWTLNNTARLISDLLVNHNGALIKFRMLRRRSVNVETVLFALLLVVVVFQTDMSND